MDIISLDNNKITIFAGRVLAGNDFTPLNNRVITIEKGRITSIKKQEANSFEKGGDFYSFPPDYTLLPALIDAHIHIGLGQKPSGGDSFARGRVETDCPQCLSDQKLKDELYSFLENGIYAVRDGGDAASFNLAVSNALKSGVLCGPLMVPTGEALRKVKGYGSFLGRGFGGIRDIPHITDCFADAGIGQLKVIVSGIVSFREYGKVGRAPITDEELSFIVNCAHKKNLKVMAHASSAEAVKKAIAAGVDSVEHGYFIEDDSLKQMAERQIFWIPTIIPVATQATRPFDFDKTPQQLDVIKRTYERQMDKLCLAVSEGVPVGVGSDSGASGVRHGHDYHRELLLYQEAGLPAKSILKAAITENASLLSLGGATIKKGSCTALIVVKGNPLSDIRALKAPVAFFRKSQ